MASTPTPSPGQCSSVRAKYDPAWNHVTEEKDVNGKKYLICLYCRKKTKGGGINRMKQHLAGRRGEIEICKKVPHDVRYQMEESLKEVATKKKEAQTSYEQENPYGPNVPEFELDMEGEPDIQEIPCPQQKGSTADASGGSNVARKNKRKASTGLQNYFAPRTTPGAQPSLRSAFAQKEVVWRADMSVARLMFDACIPFNALNSIYFQPMFDAVAAVGPGYKVPTYHAMRVNLLKDCKKEVSLLVETYRNTWADSGCTIMADGWTDITQRTLINFLVYCPRGISFVKSVDASDVIKDAKTLFLLFNELVEWVGPSNVVHLVTDNASNYVAAGRLLCERYPNISWSPCAAHCLNLILKDIAKMNHVENLAKRASKVTIFVYNHVFILSWLRKRPQWKEIICPGMTRFATTFIALNSLHEHKHDLRALVVSRYFVDSRLAKTNKAKEVVSIIMDDKFWNDCLIIVKVAAPLMRLLRIVDSDEKPALGYVYEGMYRARLGIKKLFKFKKILYQPYTRVIKDRWDRQLRQNIHAAAYWLNPAFQYDQETFCNKPEVMSGVLDVIDTKATCSKTKLLAETRLFRDRLESFSRELALITSNTTQPDEWWRLFGHSTPNLQKLAIRLLSQTASSSRCERNWSVFERIHTKKRNKLEHQRLNDLVYVHYNLRLKNRLYYKKRNYDPVDYDSIDKTEFWIVEEEGTPELNYEELEQMLYDNEGVPRNAGQSNCSLDVAENENNDILEGGEEINLGTFGGVDGEDGENESDNDDDDGDIQRTQRTPRMWNDPVM